MATLTVYSSAADGEVQGVSATYATARSTATAGYDNTTATYLYAGQSTGYYCREAFIGFDTSSLTAAAAVSEAVLSLYTIENGTDTDSTMEARLRDWGTTVTTADWVAGANLGNYALLATFDTANISGTRYETFTDVAFPANVNKTGVTRLLIDSSRQRVGNQPSGNEHWGFASSEAAGTTTDPKLVVTYAVLPTVTAAVRAVGIVTRATGHRTAALTRATATVRRSIGHQTTSVVRAVATVRRATTHKATAAVRAVATVTRSSTHPVTALARATATVARNTGHRTTAGVRGAATVGRAIAHKTTASVLAAATVTRDSTHSVLAAVRAVASVLAQGSGGAAAYDVLVQASVRATATVWRGTSHTLAARVRSVATVQRAIGHQVTAGIRAVATIRKAIGVTIRASVRARAILRWGSGRPWVVTIPLQGSFSTSESLSGTFIATETLAGDANPTIELEGSL